MLSLEKVYSKNDEFIERVKLSFAALRFFTLREINSLESDCKTLIAEVLCDLSKISGDARLLIDNIAQMQEELFIPAARNAQKEIANTDSNSYRKTMQSLYNDISTIVKKRHQIEHMQVDLVANQARLVNPLRNEPVFRDIESAISMISNMDSINELNDGKTESSIDDVLSLHFIFKSKYQNTAVKTANDMRAKITAYEHLDKMLSAFLYAKILRSKFNLVSLQDIEAFLAEDESQLVDRAWEEICKYYREEA